MNSRNVGTIGNRLPLPSSPDICTPWTGVVSGELRRSPVAGRPPSTDAGSGFGVQSGAGGLGQGMRGLCGGVRQYGVGRRHVLRLRRVLAEEVRDRLVHLSRMATERE